MAPPLPQDPPLARRLLPNWPSLPSLVSLLVLTVQEHCIAYTAACSMHSGQKAQQCEGCQPEDAQEKERVR